jgi:hypothetical protein
MITAYRTLYGPPGFDTFDSYGIHETSPTGCSWSLLCDVLTIRDAA